MSKFSEPAATPGDAIAVSIESTRTPRVGRRTRRTRDLAGLFGLPPSALSHTIAPGKDIAMCPGRVVLVTGPSGSGKSATLERVSQQVADARHQNRVAFEPGAAIIDQVAPWAALDEAIGLLTACGLGDAHLWLRTFDSLSDGERYRASLARSIALISSRGGMGPLLCDEFGSVLHRRAALAIAHNLRKLATARRFCAIVATNDRSLETDLRPDMVVRLDPARGCEIQEPAPKGPRVFSLTRRLVIEPGGKRDYDAFAAMHYRASDELGFVDKVFVLRERGGDALGIVVYCHPAIENALRNRSTGGRFSRQPAELNRCVRVLRRLVIHPDVRGCGLGALLVRKTLPLAGTEYVECLASMGAFSPVFQKAGMTRVGQYEIQPSRQRAVDELRALGVDPLGGDFADIVARQRRVRAIAGAVVREWYATTTAGGESRVDRQSASFLAQTFRGLIGARPVYFLWKRDAGTRQNRSGAGRAATCVAPRVGAERTKAGRTGRGLDGTSSVGAHTPAVLPPDDTAAAPPRSRRPPRSVAGRPGRSRPRRIPPAKRRDAKHDPREPNAGRDASRGHDET